MPASTSRPCDEVRGSSSSEVSRSETAPTGSSPSGQPPGKSGQAPPNASSAAFNRGPRAVATSEGLAIGSLGPSSTMRPTRAGIAVGIDRAERGTGARPQERQGGRAEGGPQVVQVVGGGRGVEVTQRRTDLVGAGERERTSDLDQAVRGVTFGRIRGQVDEGLRQPGVDAPGRLALAGAAHVEGDDGVLLANALGERLRHRCHPGAAVLAGAAGHDDQDRGSRVLTRRGCPRDLELEGRGRVRLVAQRHLDRSTLDHERRASRAGVGDVAEAVGPLDRLDVTPRSARSGRRGRRRQCRGRRAAGGRRAVHRERWPVGRSDGAPGDGERKDEQGGQQAPDAASQLGSSSSSGRSIRPFRQ